MVCDDLAVWQKDRCRFPAETAKWEVTMGSMIEFARPDGGKTKGYLATAGQAGRASS